MCRSILLFAALATTISLLLVCAPTAQAVPDFAIRAANDCSGACHDYLGELPQVSSKTRCSLSCMGCHTGPGGGGMRNKSGFRYSEKMVSADWIDTGEGIIPEAGKFIRFGADFKLMSMFPDSELADEYRSYFVMESGAYLSFEPHDKLILVLEHDLRNGFGQYYAMIKDLPYNMYIMGGRFLLPYGLKVADHTSFIRQNLGFSINSQDEGLLFGLNPGRPYLNVSYTNGNRGSRGFDRNDEKAVTANLGYAHERFTVGGSYYRDKTPDSELTMMGGLGGVHFWQMSLLGEFDAIDAGGDVTGSASLIQLNYFPVKGVNVALQHETFDPDTDAGQDDESRISAGVQVFPLPFLELDAHFRRRTGYVDRDSDMKKESSNEFVFIIHGFI